MNTVQDHAIMIHEVFISYVKAGFTREESLEIILEHMRITFEGTGE